MSSKLEKNSPILIVGAGTFGLSTALELALSGYTNITVLEKDNQVPPRFSAGCDLNKIVRAEYGDPFYTPLALAAIEAWKKPLYAPHFHLTGLINATSAAAPQRARTTVQNYHDSVVVLPGYKEKIARFSNGEGMRQLTDGMLTGKMEGYTGYLNRQAGYAHAANALAAVYQECVEHHVRFVLGEGRGKVAELLYSKIGSENHCIGARTLDGKEHLATRTIIALGANAVSLIPSLSTQITARCWGVAHIQLTPQEATALRGIPVVMVRDLAFFFEPDQTTNLLKLCPMGGGYTNMSRRTGISLPFDSLRENAFVPEDDERVIREVLRHTLPHLADRPLIDQHLCWFADSPDSNFIIDYVPKTNESLVVLSGDSGHGFKFFPTFGGYVKALLESGEEKQVHPEWRWKHYEVNKGDEDVSWRSGSSADLNCIAQARL